MAAQRALVKGTDERLLSLEGEQVIVSKREGLIYAQITPKEGEPLRIPFEELGLLSSDREERLEALDRCLQRIGPMGSDFSGLRHAATERDLSEEEVGEILDAQWNGAAGRQTRLRAQLEAAEATVWDLVPDSLDYFEQFCGPDPGDLSPEEYLRSVLPEYRKNLLRRDLQQGLRICLMGSLRDDLCPGAWLEEADDNELLEALEACEPLLEPFSLLGALDIALYRQHNKRFSTFAEDAVTKLINDQFVDSEGTDLYTFLPTLAQFIVNRINLLEGGTLRAPFWKRMCAWMHASVVIHFLQPLGGDLETLGKLLDTNLGAAGRYSTLFDLRQEPIYTASEISPFSLRREITHRLLHLQTRHAAADRILPKADDIGEAAARLNEKAGRPLYCLFPGPLEGHRRPEVLGSMLAEESKDRLLKLPADLLLSNMVNLSPLFHFDEETRACLREIISKGRSKSEYLSPEEQLSRLANAGLVAAAERDREMAQAIAGAILVLTPALQESTAVVTGLQALLITSAAFEEEGAWAGWLEEQLVGFAARLPAGKLSTTLYHHLQELKKVTKLDLGLYSRAEALASAAAS